jgi:protein-S-isoprenylcysteine O-methyltransferase Ste14
MPTDSIDPRLGALVLLWLIYFGLHSLLASLWLKRQVARAHPHWMPGYRLFFNLCAVLLLLPPLALTYGKPGPSLWQWNELGWWAANGLAAASLLGFAWSLRWYDGLEFLGLRQWRGGLISVEDQERFRLSPLHRFVRHPWYSQGLVLIWTRDMDPAFLTTAVMITLYFVLGSRLEERKLLVYHGDVYRRYRRLVPSLIPVPWRYLTREQADNLAAGVSTKRPAGRR